MIVSVSSDRASWRTGVDRGRAVGLGVHQYPTVACCCDGNAHGRLHVVACAPVTLIVNAALVIAAFVEARFTA